MTPAEVVTALVAACERRDLDAVCALVTDDIEYDNVPMRKVHGPEQVRAGLEPFFAMMGGIEWVVHHQVAVGDVVMNERVDRFELAGRWIELPVAGLFVLRDGRIALWRDYFDLATFERAMAGG
jgi:limonene-1,2-epoxide hydrolase